MRLGVFTRHMFEKFKEKQVSVVSSKAQINDTCPFTIPNEENKRLSGHSCERVINEELVSVDFTFLKLNSAFFSSKAETLFFSAI